jgi:hypothetical protein
MTVLRVHFLKLPADSMERTRLTGMFGLYVNETQRRPVAPTASGLSAGTYFAQLLPTCLTYYSQHNGSPSTLRGERLMRGMARYPFRRDLEKDAEFAD